MAKALEGFGDLIELHLTREEARTVAVVMSYVSGSLLKSPRKHTDEILEVLNGVVGYYMELEEHGLADGGTIRFYNYPSKPDFDGGDAVRYLDSGAIYVKEFDGHSKWSSLRGSKYEPDIAADLEGGYAEVLIKKGEKV